MRSTVMSVSWWLLALGGLSTLFSSCDTDLKIQTSDIGQTLTLTNQSGLETFSGTGTLKDPFVFSINEGVTNASIKMEALATLRDELKTIKCSSLPAWAILSPNGLLPFSPEQKNVSSNNEFQCQLPKALGSTNAKTLYFVGTVLDVNYAPDVGLAVESTIPGMTGKGEQSNPYRLTIKRGLEQVRLAIPVTDHDQDRMEIVCDHKVSWITVDQKAKEILAVPGAEAVTGEYQFSCHASDGAQASASSVFFILNVIDPVSSSGLKVVYETKPGNFAVGGTTHLKVKIVGADGQLASGDSKTRLFVGLKNGGFVASVSQGLGGGSGSGSRSLEMIQFQNGVVALEIGAQAPAMITVSLTTDPDLPVPEPLEVAALDQEIPNQPPYDLNVSIPRIRDFRGFSPKAFDGRGNYSLGIKEQIMFPEIDYDKVDRIRGLGITIVTNAANDIQAKALLERLNFPFRKN